MPPTPVTLGSDAGFLHLLRAAAAVAGAVRRRAGVAGGGDRVMPAPASMAKNCESVWSWLLGSNVSPMP